jgi:phenylpropionate dioxygenase-like ring-hydroxylating dioxygenase large terminal subunit
MAPAWTAVAASEEVADDPHQVWAEGRPWVLVRFDGDVVAFADRCPHRMAPISAGRRVDATLECGYHGWRFDRTGRAVAIPSLGDDAAIPPRACLTILPVREEDGFVYISLPDDPE